MKYTALDISEMRVLIPAIMILIIGYAISVSANFDEPGPAGWQEGNIYINSFEIPSLKIYNLITK